MKAFAKSHKCNTIWVLVWPLLTYHSCLINTYRDHLYWDQVFSYITLFHDPDAENLRAKGCLHTVCHTLLWQDYSTTGSLPWHRFFCLFLELPFPHEALPCTMTATATSNHILFIEMLQLRSDELYLDITMNWVLFFAAMTCLGLIFFCACWKSHAVSESAFLCKAIVFDNY